MKSNPKYLYSPLAKPLETDMQGEGMNVRRPIIPSGNTFKTTCTLLGMYSN